MNHPKRILISGGSRGIGRAIALKFAAEGAKVAIAAKSVVEHPNLPGTIYSVADEIRAAGGEALPLECDLRDDGQIERAVAQCVAAFGGLDLLVNNASAISLAPVAQVDVKKFDLMWTVNVRGSLLLTKAAIPLLRQGVNPHIVTLSPPPLLDASQLNGLTPYALTKYGMSLLMLGLSAELRPFGIACNTLWPKTVILTDALRALGQHAPPPRHCRWPQIVADALWHLVQRPASECSGNFFLDEALLRQSGVTNFDPYAVEPGEELMADLFVTI